MFVFCRETRNRFPEANWTAPERGVGCLPRPHMRCSLGWRTIATRYACHVLRRKKLKPSSGACPFSSLFLPWLVKPRDALMKSARFLFRNSKLLFHHGGFHDFRLGLGSSKLKLATDLSTSLHTKFNLRMMRKNIFFDQQINY